MNTLIAPLGELRRTLRLVGCATFAAVTLHAVLALPNKPGRLTPDEVLPWCLSLVGYLAAFWWATQPRTDQRASAWTLLLIAAETALALIANHIFDGNSLLSGLLLVVAAQMGLLTALPLALAWVGVQTLGLLTVLLLHWPASDAWAYTTGYLCFQIFAAGSGHLTVREARARQALAQANTELRRTRALLDEASRNAERLEIARELHDLLGHHLAALSMNLEVAAHVCTEPPARLHLERSQAVARSLLSDVRQVVGSMRGAAQCDFRREVAQLAGAAGAVQVHLSFSDDFVTLGPIQAHILLRCVQEVLTNTVKHAGATHLWLEFSRTHEGVRFEARDDGRGAGQLRSGCGLSGMRERLESIGGALHLESAPGQGLSVLARLPFASAQPSA